MKKALPDMQQSGVKVPVQKSLRKGQQKIQTRINLVMPTKNFPMQNIWEKVIVWYGVPMSAALLF